MSAQAADPARAHARTLQPPRRRAGAVLMTARGCGAAVLVVVTVAGTFALTAMPFAWVLLVAKLGGTFSLPPLVPLAVLLIGIPGSMIAGVKGLLWVSDLYERLRRHDGPTARVAPVWRRGLTDTSRPRQPRMLDVVMVVSVCCSIVALFAWFVLFAGHSVQL